MCRFLVMVSLLLLAQFVPVAFCEETEVKPLTLSESIRIALERNADVRAADHAVHVADFERKAARTDFLPKVSTEHSYIRYDETPYAKSPAGEFGPSAMKYKTGTRGRYQWNTSVTQPIFTGGAIMSSYQIAKLGSDIAQQNRSRTRQDIILQVKEAYFTILKTEKIKAVADQAVEQVRSHVDVAKAMFEEEMV
ncbi:MAG: TolC family protein, partial [Pseudomonadota bacterium]